MYLVNSKTILWNSALLNKLKYYPIALLLIIVLFAGLVYNFTKALKWLLKQVVGGNGKRNAHQIGTPLSSLIGWVEILKADNIEESTTLEIEKTLKGYRPLQKDFQNRLRTGIEKKDIVDETLQSYKYLQSRFSKQIDLLSKSFVACFVMLNASLHSWTIENLVKKRN
jgi:hypothetical protein